MSKARTLFFAAIIAAAIPFGAYHAFYAVENARAKANGIPMPQLTRWGPKDAVRHPAVLLLHGGAGPVIFEKAPDYRRYPQALETAGYVVVMPYYAEVDAEPEETARAVLAWMRKQPEIDPARIAVVGFSAGGFVAMATAATDPGIAAAVDVYGGLSSDVRVTVPRMPPTLILHGADDESVPVLEAYKLEKLLQVDHVDYEIHIYKDQEHGFNGAALDDSVTRIVTFLNARMKH